MANVDTIQPALRQIAALCQIALSVVDLRTTDQWFREGLGFVPAGGSRLLGRGPLAAWVQGLPRAAGANQPNPVAERVRAIQQKQAAQREAGLIDNDTPALVACRAGDHDPLLESAGSEGYLSQHRSRRTCASRRPLNNDRFWGGRSADKAVVAA
jgi:hypothetical protein